jgi:hypothetical protein
VKHATRAVRRATERVELGGWATKVSPGGESYCCSPIIVVFDGMEIVLRQRLG